MEEKDEEEQRRGSLTGGVVPLQAPEASIGWAHVARVCSRAKVPGGGSGAARQRDGPGEGTHCGATTPRDG